MSDFSEKVHVDERNEEEIRREIERSVAAHRQGLRIHHEELVPERRSFTLPVVVNATLLVVVIAATVLLWRVFLGNEANYILRSTDAAGPSADIVAALLAEGEAALSETEATINRLQSELGEIEARLAAMEAEIRNRLDSIRARLEDEGRSTSEIDQILTSERRSLEEDFNEERQALLARRDVVETELEAAIARQNTLSAQVAAQRGVLETADETATGGATQLNDLREAEQLRRLFNDRITNGYRTFALAVGRRDWEAAREQLVSLSGFIADQELTSVAGIEDQLDLHGLLIPRLEELLLIAEEGFPEDAAADILPGWAEVRGDLENAQRLASQGNVAAAIQVYEEAITSIPGMTAGVGYMTRRAEQRSVGALSAAVDRLDATGTDDPAAALRTLTNELTSRSNDVPPPVRSLTVRLTRAVEAVEAQREELAQLTELSEQQLILLRRSVAAEGERDDDAARDDTLDTVERIAAEIDALQDRVAESRARQEEMTATVASLRRERSGLEDQIQALETENAALSAEHDQLQTVRSTVEALTTAYEAALSQAQQELRADDDAPRVVLEDLISPFDRPEGVELFPRLSGMVRTLVAFIVENERDLAAAEAEERLLRQVEDATERVSEEQIRLLEFSDNAEEDTVQLLNTLVREIDMMTETTRTARDDVAVPQALGVIVDGNVETTMIVQSALDIDSGTIERVYVSRLLPDGDRIPIADAEIVATTRDSIAIRITSTIAPSITPERNDVVFAEFRR